MITIRVEVHVPGVKKIVIERKVTDKIGVRAEEQFAVEFNDAVSDMKILMGVE